MARFLLCIVAAAVLVSSCGDDAAAIDAGGGSDAGASDSGGTDAGATDAGRADAGASDSGETTDAGVGDTWASFAMEFFVTYCVECHSGGARDYTAIDDVMRDQATIRCGVSPYALAGCGSFPPPSQFPVGGGPFPTDDERRRLVAWIDAGLS